MKGHLVGISRFREFLGQPSANGDVECDWGVLEERTRVTLPYDYKEFVTAYGPGSVNGQLYLFHPRAVDGDQGLRLEYLWDQAGYAYRELTLSNPDLYPYPVYPAKGGCVPIARSVSGNHVLLMPPGEGSEEWRVVFDMGQWVVLEMNFTDFLWAAPREELFVPVIDGEPCFERIGDIDPL
ncbi:SMI1/KNR4 family protein [Streptomyces sp. NBC_00827]|uniref:SMI1/KNR4 family protein n=1 Tax=Streptomyces sp. NBC_00827 TaxID=2903677 RepID=UPI00386F1492|nr:SMI1/KNR4 family protein [Streptomyces sp. NBC_00827]